MGTVIRLLRVLGFLLIAAGACVLLTWLIRPLRALWPWLMQLPAPIRIGLGAAAAGFVLLLATLIWERVQELEKNRGLRDDE